MPAATIMEPHTVIAGPSTLKHSSGDLHSRLKTRKLLGVGETDDGDVHRSKLSQILGHSEQLFVRLPRGLRIWQLLTAIMFSTIGAWAIIFPAHLFSFALDGGADASAILPIRLYGGALISLSVVFWSTLQSVDKDVIRWSLLGSAAYFVIQVVVSACSVPLLLTQGGYRMVSVCSVIVTYLLITTYFWLGTGSRFGHHAPQYKVERSKTQPKSKLSTFAAFMKNRMNPNGNGDSIKNKSWSSLIFQFTQDTTFHGVRYITAETPYISRRVLWTCVVMLTTSFFFWFVSDRLGYLYSYPKAVDVEVIYTDDVHFPAVTICNQNVFRMSATHHLGLHDIVEESFVALQRGEEKHRETSGKESWHTGFKVFPNSILADAKETLATYEDVSAKVCRHLCLTRHGASCCSVVYSRRSRTCFITPADMTSSKAGLVETMYVDHFHRNKCQMQTKAECNFEVDMCNFVQYTTQSLAWKRVNRASRMDPKYPSYDHTLMTGLGNYLLATNKFNQPNSFVHFVSPYILSYTITCVSFYYQVRGGTLNLRTRSHRNELLTLWSQRGPHMEHWERAIQPLPAGYFRVVMEASTGTGSALLNIAIDDVYIGECPKEKLCKDTASGRGFAGNLNSTSRNKTCQRWDAVKPFLQPIIWSYQSLDLVTETLESLQNFCRNPDDDVIGPWCMTDLDTEQMEYCDIPPCACRDVEFECDNGRCLSPDLLCDGTDHCGDLSDEMRACNYTEGITCEFSDAKACGYKTDSDSRATWNHLLYGGVEGVMWVNTEGTRDGDMALLVSPVTNLTESACLRLQYLITPGSSIDVFLQTQHTSFQNRELLCTLSSDTSEGRWNYTHLMLPNETFSLVLSATLGDPSSASILVSNITLLTENCTAFIEDIVVTTEEPYITTMVEDTEYMNITGNYTTEPPLTTEETATTVAMTTEAYNVTEEPEIPPEAIQMCSRLGTCTSCVKSFGKSKDCGSEFRLTYSAIRGLATKCPAVNNSRKVSLRECMQLARQYGANAFNFKKRRCYIKHCYTDELDLTQNSGGFNVYKLHDTREPPGISCTFSDQCACGYVHISSNIHDLWVRKPLLQEVNVQEVMSMSNQSLNVSKMGDNEVNGEPQKEVVGYFMTVENELKVAPRHNDWSRLISPSQVMVNDSCLTFRYFTRYVDIKVFRYSSHSKEKILDILHDGQLGSWHRATLALPAGKYGLIFEFVYDELWAPEYAGISHVDLRSGPCYEEEVVGTFNCTFTDDDYCGYSDASQGSSIWIRSQEYENGSPGNYYLRTSDHLEGKSSNVLYSPYSLVTNTSCVQFAYYLHGTGREQAVNTLSVSLDHWRDPRETLWSVRAVTDNSWHDAQMVVPEGYYRLQFVMSGNQIRGGIDSVRIFEGDCPALECSEEEEDTCTEVQSCIPDGLICNGMPNCHLAEDEINCSEPPANVTMSISDVVEVIQKKAESSLQFSTHPENLENIGVALELTEIYARTAHQGPDFIFSCKWEGLPCSYENMTQQVTDYGLCYTFNSHNTDLKTDKTGSRFGLSLTLNIEQYDYMIGPQSDAGIKVFLHTKQELPQVRDLGFAIPPGTHTLVGIRLNEAKNLKKPWGECASKDLKFYDEYVHSRCVRECETWDVFAACACRDAYMPGLTEDFPPICNLSMYFSCAIPSINAPSTRSARCKCPKPCEQTVFEPSLSSASLSYLSVGHILRSDNTDNLLKKYRDVLEAKQRVDENIFNKDLELLSDVMLLYNHLIGFARNNLANPKTSNFDKLDIASSSLIELFRADMSNLLEDEPDYRSAYNNYYSDTMQLVLIYLQDTKICLKELNQLLDLSINRNATHRFLGEVSRKCVTQAEMMHETIQSLLERVRIYSSDTPDMVMFRNMKKLPKRLFIKDECHSHLMTLSNIVNETATVLDEIETLAGDGLKEGPFDDSKVKTIRKNTRFYMTYLPNVTHCIEEFSSALDKTKKWIDAMPRELRNLRQHGRLSNNFNLSYEAHILEQDEKDVRELYWEYINAKTRKLDYLEHFKPDDQSSTVLSNINTFVERIEDRLTTPLRVKIIRIRDNLKELYMDALVRAKDLEKYLGDYTFYIKSSKMRIWRIPTVNMENPDRINDEGREHWKVWNRDMSMGEFVREHAEYYIETGLLGFCSELLQQLDAFEEQLVFNKQKLLAAMMDIQQAYQRYTVQRNIGHGFVLDNFLTMDVYFAQLKHQTVKQIEAYEIKQFLGDVGGFMGLLLGGSVLSVFELMDLFVFNFAKKLVARRNEEERERERMERILKRARELDDDGSEPNPAVDNNGGTMYSSPASYGMPKDAINP